MAQPCAGASVVVGTAGEVSGQAVTLLLGWSRSLTPALGVPSLALCQAIQVCQHHLHLGLHLCLQRAKARLCLRHPAIGVADASTLCTRTTQLQCQRCSTDAHASDLLPSTAAVHTVPWCQCT